MKDIGEIPITEIDRCICCEGELSGVLELPNYPFTELYEWCEIDFVDQGYLDQRLNFCDTCGHASFSKVLDVKYIYENYMTTSGGSFGAVKCLDNFETFIRRNLNPHVRYAYIDIGGNDGYLLDKFPDSYKLINIDPNARSTGDVENKNVFVEDLDLSEYKSLANKVIVSSHTLEHVVDPAVALKEISNSLRKDDYCFIQIPSLERIISDYRFDQLCHQHLHYFSYRSLSICLANADLKIIDHEYDDSHFGTLRVCAVKSEEKVSVDDEVSSSKSDILDAYDLFSRYMEVNDQVLGRISNLYGFGAGLMVPVLAYYLPSIRDLVEIYDENESKHGKRFINLNVRIVGVPSPNELASRSILICSVTTKAAARAIYQKLTERGAGNILFPVMKG